LILIDKVISLIENDSVVAIKNVSFNELIFKGHFPGNPIYPAIYTIEGLCQSAQLLTKTKIGVTAKLESFKFKKVVKPGDQLRYEVSLESSVGKLNIFKAKAFVGSSLSAKGTIYGYDL